MEQLTIGFDYGGLEPGIRREVEEYRDALKGLERRVSADIYEMGWRLSGVKDRLPHGQFGPWLAAEFGWSEHTARRFIAVFRMLGPFLKNAQIARFQPSALYALASGTVPDIVREEFIERAEAGEPVRYRDVRDRLDDLKAEPAPEPPPLLSVVDLETGEVIATAEEYAEQVRREEASAPVTFPPMREPSREERAFDRLIAMTIITDMDPVAVADAAADYRADTARLLIRRVPALESWAAAFAARLRERFDVPLRAVR